tara:strand:- start:555 stop:1826 length:1272 start_codon:yes stop_codon:yes gene_type:complete
MASSNKKVRKDQKKRDRQKRAIAKEKRRQVRSAAEPSTQDAQFADSPSDELFSDFKKDAPDKEAANPAIEQWWDRFHDVDGPQRVSMLKEQLHADLDKEWRESLFPDAIFEAEQGTDSSDYVSLLETLAVEHRQIYDLGLLWFLKSRVDHYLLVGDDDKIVTAVKQDAAALSETNEAYFGIVSTLRLAGMAGSADTLAAAGMRVMDTSDLMPWAINEMFHFFQDSQVRQCVHDGGDAKAIARLESILEEHDANMDADAVQLRAEMIRRLTGETKTKWVRNQLLGSSKQTRVNCYLLCFEFSHWLIAQRDIPPVAADELRGFVLQTLSGDGISMRSYLDGISKTALEKQLVSELGFMSLDRFKAPATLIAVEHFVMFLSEAELVSTKSLSRTRDVIASLDAQLRQVLNQEWRFFSFLDRLRTPA